MIEIKLPWYSATKEPPRDRQDCIVAWREEIAGEWVTDIGRYYCEGAGHPLFGLATGTVVYPSSKTVLWKPVDMGAPTEEEAKSVLEGE